MNVFATLECELIDQPPARNQAEAQIAVLRVIEVFDNPTRPHSSIGYTPPMEFEAARQPDRAKTLIT